MSTVQSTIWNRERLMRLRWATKIPRGRPQIHRPRNRMKTRKAPSTMNHMFVVVAAKAPAQPITATRIKDTIVTSPRPVVPCAALGGMAAGPAGGGAGDGEGGGCGASCVPGEAIGSSLLMQWTMD